MKKLFKLCFIFILSFLFINYVNAGNPPGSCGYHVDYVKNTSYTGQTSVGNDFITEEGDLVHSYEEYTELLHDTGWNAYAYKCVVNTGRCTTVNTGCKFSSAEVATWQCYKTMSSTCTFMHSGIKGYGYGGTYNCSTRIPVPCEEPPAILCKVSCSIDKCPRTVYDQNCRCVGGSSSSDYNICVTHGGTWHCDGRTVYDQTKTKEYGGGDDETIDDPSDYESKDEWAILSYNGLLGYHKSNGETNPSSYSQSYPTGTLGKVKNPSNKILAGDSECKNGYFEL
jgi:hypothetical protein